MFNKEITFVLLKNIIKMENEDKERKEVNDSNYNLFLIGRKRNNSLKSEDSEIEMSKKNENKNEKYCDYCNHKINMNLNNDDSEIKNYIMSTFFQQNQNEFKNIISDVIDSFEKEEKINFYKNIQNLCQACFKTIFIEGGLSNILDKNKLNNDELKLLLSDNKNIEEIINEIKKDMEDIIIKDEKKLEINIICKIIQMKNKIVKCYDKLRENNIYLAKNINKNDNEFEFEDNDDDDDDNDNENDNKKIGNYDERKFNIDNSNSMLFPGKNNTTFDLSKKKYTIFSKGKIYESKYESIPKSKLSKTFIFNSPNQIKNYIYNLPVLITNNSNIILKENNDKKKDKIIYTLSDIKNLESQSNLRKSTINSMIMPVKFQTLEIEKQISKLKEKEKWIGKDINLPNLQNKNDEIQNNSKNELNDNKIKNIKDNNNVNDITLYNNIKQNNNYISNKCLDNIGYKNKNNIIGMNNNNLQIDNNANIDYNILLKYLLSSSLINKRLINQIVFGNEQTNLISDISKKNLLENLINNNNDGNMNNNNINNLNNNCPTLNDKQNNDNSNRINSINQNLNFLNNNNLNENLNLSNEKNMFNDSKNINIIPTFGICNNIQSFYNSNLLNRNNINTFPNEISLDKNNLIRNSLNNLKELIGINTNSENINMNSSIQSKTNLNNFNFGFNNQNII